MSTFTSKHHKRLSVWFWAGLLALAIAYAPMALDAWYGTSYTPQVHACQSATGGC